MSTPLLPARFPDPPNPPTAQKTLSRWDQFIGSLATGTKVEDAMLQHYMKRKDIEAVIRANPAERKKYQEAKLAGLRAAYSEFDLEEFFNRVAMGTLVATAYMEVFGREISATFYQLLREDAELEERYQTALKTKAMLEMEKALNIIDDDTHDTLPGPKGGEIPNMAAVNRSRLKFEGRSKLAGNWYRRLYGEQEKKAEVTVNLNLAERLERGIQNARARKIAAPSEIIDAEVVPVEKPMDTSWMDDPSTSTIWREEK